MSKICFRGILPALITPLDASGHVMKKSVERLVEEQLAAGVAGFYVTGGTGEGVLLSLEQRREMVEAVLAANRHRGKVIVQVGAFHFEDVLTLTRHATTAGADGISSVLPSLYFHYSLEETQEYYKRIAGETALPVLLYAQPGAAFPNVNELVEKLLAVPNIVGVKDTRANYYQMWQLKQLAGGDVNVINGPDESLLCGLTMGADGGIGATYNVMPERFVRLYQAFQKGDLAKAREEQTGINRVIQLLIQHSKGYTVRTVKEILRFQGHEPGISLPPAREMTDDERKALRTALESIGFLG